MYQYKVTNETENKAKKILSNNINQSSAEDILNTSKGISETLAKLREINDTFSTKNDTVLPNSPDFTRMQDVNIDEEKIKNNAISELENYKNTSINNINKSFENDEKELNKNIEILKDTANSQKESVKENFENLRENASNDALKRGLARSSIIINTLDAFNNKEIETYNQIDKELSNNINAINFELSALNSNYEDALNNFDIEYASKLAEKINTATEKLKAEQEKVIKYNNEIAEKEAEFNQSLTKLEQDIKDSEWDKEIDAMNLYGKYGTLVVEKYKNNKMYNTALNYFSNFSNEKALYLLEGNPEFKTLLGEATYNKLLENFK